MTLTEVFKAYQTPDRHYHNLDHITGSLQLLAEVSDDIFEPFLVEKAIIFHDKRYNIKAAPHVNEIDSASDAEIWYRETFHLPERNPFDPPNPVLMRLERLILVTAHDPLWMPPLTSDEKYMADIDLAGLGSSPEEFAKNSNNVRLEYMDYSDEDYRQGRIKFLSGMLKRDSIYYTDVFKARCEAQARKNITAELLKFLNL